MTVDQTLVKVTLTNPNVILRPGERRIGVELDASVSTPLGGTLRGRVAALGDPVYDRDSKSFFLRNPVVERFDFGNLDIARNDRVRDALSAVAARALQDTPVYTLQGRDEKERKAELWLKEVYIKDERLYLVLSP